MKWFILSCSSSQEKLNSAIRRWGWTCQDDIFEDCKVVLSFVSGRWFLWSQCIMCADLQSLGSWFCGRSEVRFRARADQKKWKPVFILEAYGYGSPSFWPLCLQILAFDVHWWGYRLFMFMWRLCNSVYKTIQASLGTFARTSYFISVMIPTMASKTDCLKNRW